MVAAGATVRCDWCMEMETALASRAFLIDTLMDERDALKARNTELVSDNRRLRLALGMARPALAMVREEGVN